MADDIVTRLREAGECPTPLRAYLARAVVLRAADEIERLRAERDEANANAKLYRDERDEARQEVCRRQKRSVVFDEALAEANRRGWDCFKEPVHAS